jgi:hypothetical protein
MSSVKKGANGSSITISRSQRRSAKHQAQWVPGYPGNHLAAAIDEAAYPSRVERRQKKLRLPVQKLMQWEIWCTVHQIDFQKLVEDALDLFMLQAELSGNPGTQAPTINDLNDLIVDENESVGTSSSDQSYGYPGTHDKNPEERKAQEVLAFYAQKTGNKIKPRDRHAYENGFEEWSGVSELPEHVIHYGIMESILICKGRINSFAYCLGAIHRIAETGISPEIVNLFLRTWDVRFAAKGNPVLNSRTVDFASPDYQKYFDEMRSAASQSAALPGVGADLVAIEPSTTTFFGSSAALETASLHCQPNSEGSGNKPVTMLPHASPKRKARCVGARGSVIQMALFRTQNGDRE